MCLNRPDGVKSFLQAADVFVLPSLAEGLSNALLEALSASLPAVVTDVGGNADLVVNGQNGLVVPAGSHEALANAMLRLADSPQEWTHMSMRAKERLRDYSIESVAARYLQLYEKLVEEKSLKKNH